MMSRIRGKDTEPEILLRNELKAGRAGARIGRIQPDLVFWKERLAVFVDGCFWHGCPDHYVRPRSNEKFWSSKLTENTERDTRQTRALIADGWLIVRFWEHEVRADPARAAHTVRSALLRRRSRVERWRVVAVSEGAGETEIRTERRLIQDDQWRLTKSRRITLKAGKVRRQIVKVGRGTIE